MGAYKIPFYGLNMSKAKFVFRSVFIAWTACWLLFLTRGLVKGEFDDYKNLSGMTPEEKRAYVTGEEFYAFIIFCKGIIPEGSDYTVEAVYDDSMDYFRFAYYMHPSLRNLDDAEYIVCYKTDFSKKGYRREASLGKDKYILKKREAR